MTVRLLLPLLAASALALACGPRSHSDLASRTPAHGMKEDTGLARAAARARRARHEGEIAPALVVDTTGDAVRIALAVANAGNKTIEMHFRDGQTHDLVVLDASGREVWRWARGRLFTQVHRTEIVAGGDTVTVEGTWRAPAPSGRYTAVATLRSTNFPVEERVDFVLQ